MQSGDGWYDPIVFPGRVSGPVGPWYWSHRHWFAGTLPSPSSLGPDLLSTPSGCSLAADHSAYWFPVVLAGGYYTTVAKVEVRYDFTDSDVEDLSTLTGVGLIAGDGKANDEIDVRTDRVRWDCADGSEPPAAGPIQCGEEGANVVVVPMRETLVFPSCWDGTVRPRAATSYPPCAPGFVRIPTITMVVEYAPHTQVDHGNVTYTGAPTIGCYVADDVYRALGPAYAAAGLVPPGIDPVQYIDGIYGTYSRWCGHGDVLLAWE